MIVILLGVVVGMALYIMCLYAEYEVLKCEYKIKKTEVRYVRTMLDLYKKKYRELAKDVPSDEKL